MHHTQVEVPCPVIASPVGHGAFEEFAQIPSESRVKIGGAMATAAGGLVANLENGETWFFRSGEEEWTRSW